MAVPACLHSTAGSPNPSAGVSRDRNGLCKGRAELQHLCTTQTHQLLAKQWRKISSSSKGRNLCSKNPSHSRERSPSYTIICSSLRITSAWQENGALSEFSTVLSPQGTGGTHRSVAPRCVPAPVSFPGPLPSRAAVAQSSGPGGSGVCEPHCPRCRRAPRLPHR